MTTRKHENCSVHNCLKPHDSRGYCSEHYYYFKRYGDPTHRTRVRKGHGHVTPQGYRRVKVKVGGKYHFEHRVVMAEKLGRDLHDFENVHHINGDKSDNHPDNLELWAKVQPSGQRVADKVAYACKILQLYGEMPVSPTPLSSTLEIRNNWEVEPCEARVKLDSDGLCLALGCQALPKHRGFCRSHYRSFIRKGWLTVNPQTDRSCVVADCNNRHQAKGFCEYHYAQSRTVGVERGRLRGHNGKGTITEDGYRVHNIKGRPRLEHRLVMESFLGRVLLPHESVHHLNGDRLDNRVSNLELWSKSQPAGQRASDKVRWAKEFLSTYQD